MSNDISHLLIEALEKGEVGLSIKKGSVVADHVLRAGVSSVRMPHALRDIRASHRFDISGVVPTLSSELSLTAIDQNADGQLHLPFEGCLFDFGLNDHGERMLILAGEGDHDLAFSLFFLEGGEWGTYPYVLMVRKGEAADTCIYFRPLFEGFPLAAEPSDENPTLEWLSAKSLAALAMMDSESVKLEAVTAPKFINAKRAAKGKPPLSDYTLVTIDMDRVRQDTERLGGTHASPRLHWRRGHRRHLPDGKATWVRACLVGDPFAGTVSHDYQLTTGEAA
jgi:hypothetical protein